MTKKTQVGLIFGGNSSEYEVSIVSGRNIYKAIDKEKFDVHPIWITNEGYFANEEESFKVLEDPSYQAKNPHKVHNISNLIELENLPEIDVFFPIVHGNLGEDGVLQGLFRLMNKPFVGDDVLAAAVTMDKEFTKILAQRVGVPVADWIAIKRFEYDDKNNDKLDYEKVAEKLGRDMFVKPSNQGSSVGVSHVTNADEYAAALKEAFNDKPIVAGVGQITNAKGSFYSYKNKYDDNSTSKLQIPADLPQEIIDTVRRNARKVYEVTECSGMARIDSMLTPGGKVVLTEVNALPGFTNISMYPKLFEEAGVPYTELITRLIEVGMERFDHKKTLLQRTRCT
ncbi:D-alanine--D-alanine ligase family protein [Lactobacillus gallinarum]|uniref:D-alanine--D-alanine ligase family protein n=1 Tax=Lactobacillus gallinarum TaxID=52242 RepID=UPI00174DF318|nr:D-alanine--D-alanine ligase family protein [Lactobacillus gallinarum]